MLAVPREPRVLQSESGVGQRGVKLSYGLTQSWEYTMGHHSFGKPAMNVSMASRGLRYRRDR